MYLHREEDVCVTMYPSVTSSTNGHHDPPPTRGEEGGQDKSKLDCVCDAVREELQRCGENFYLLSIITTYIKMTQPRVETVLCMIQALKGQRI